MSITPERNTIMKVFSSNKQYYLDFYQRHYQWKRVYVEKLLEDIFLPLQPGIPAHKRSQPGVGQTNALAITGYPFDHTNECVADNFVSRKGILLTFSQYGI